MTTTERVANSIAAIKKMSEEELSVFLAENSYRVGYGSLRPFSLALRTRITTYADLSTVIAHYRNLDCPSVVRQYRRKAAAELGLIRRIARTEDLLPSKVAAKHIDNNVPTAEIQEDKQVANNPTHGSNDTHVVASEVLHVDRILDDISTLSTQPTHTAHIAAYYRSFLLTAQNSQEGTLAMTSTPESPSTESGLKKASTAAASTLSVGSDAESTPRADQEAVLSLSEARALAEVILDQLCTLDSPTLSAVMDLRSDVQVRPTFIFHPDGWLPYDVHVVLGYDSYDITTLSQWTAILECYLLASV